MPRRTDQDEKKAVSKIVIYKLKADFPADKALGSFQKQKEGFQDGWKFSIYTRSKPGQLPSWKPLVKDYVVDEILPRSSYASLVILLERNNNKYALTAGYGYANVRAYVVSDFGIDIACKTLDPNQLDHLYQKTPTGSVYGWVRSLRGKYLPTSDSLNKRSVLKALRGKTIDKGLGVTIEGRTSLVVSGKKDFSDVIEFMNKLQGLENSSLFTIKIKGLDEVSKSIREKLDAELLNRINGGAFDNVLFGYDDDLIFNNCEKIRVGKDKNSYFIDDTEGVMVAAQSQNKSNPASVTVIGLDENEQIIFNKQLIDLVEGEVDLEGEKYFRIDRKWYKTNPEYIEQIHKDFNEVERVDNGYLPKWPQNNGKFVIEDEFLGLDLGANRILGHKQKIQNIELADIIDKERYEFIHIKRGKGAYLRNLFAQGYVSGSLYYGNEDFKKAAKDKFGIDISQRYTVVFGICGEEEKNLDSIFTLFAKVDFLERCDSLRNMGFNVKYYLI